MGKTYAEQYAGFVKALKFEEIPKDVIEHTKELILDTLGICIASTRQPYAQLFHELVLDMGGKEESSVVGGKLKVPAPNAALVNGTLAHYLDYDDSHLKSAGHVSATIVPAALSVGEAKRISGKEFLTAAVAGYECITRIGMTLPVNFHDKGFHCTGIVGPFGAAVVTGKIENFNADLLTSALGICGSQAAALMECRYDGTMVKRMHPGWSAHSGIIAARLAQKGFTGPRSVFEGNFGLYLSHIGPGNYDPSILDTLGKEWETLNCLIKPYPCSHYLHPYIDAAIALRDRERIDVDDIEHIELLVSDTGAKLTCEAASVHTPPASAYVAQFSLRYAVALALIQNNILLDDFREPKITDSKITALGQKISHKVHERMTFGAGGYYSGWIKIKMKGGAECEYFQEFNRGSRQNPLRRGEVARKFYDNTAGIIPSEKAREIAERVGEMEAAKHIEPLADLVRF